MRPASGDFWTSLACINWALLVQRLVLTSSDTECERLTYKYSDGTAAGGGRVFQTPTFYSPRFPQPYRSGIQCIMFNFIGDENHIVQLTFLEFDLQLPRPARGCIDYLRLYLDLQPGKEVTDTTTPSYELCGNISTLSTKQFYSSTPNLVMRFHSGLMRGNQTGFRGIYRFIDKAMYQWEGGKDRWGSTCTYDFYSGRSIKSGRFFSPRYPQPYLPATVCQYIFFGLRTERVRVTFQNIQLESPPPDGSGGCASSPDRLTVRDGVDQSPSTPVLAQFCGTSNGQTVTSSGEHLHIELITDAINQRQGFAAEFSFFTASTMLNTGGSAVAVGGPGGGRLATGTGVVSTALTIGEAIDASGAFQTPTQPSELGDGRDNNNGQLNLDDSPFQQQSTTPNSASYKEYASRNELTSGSFESPLYPEPYPAYVSNRYYFRGRDGERVKITFEDFDLSYNMGDPNDTHSCAEVDSVIVYYTSTEGSSQELEMFCGTRRPPSLMSTDSNMELAFVSRTLPETKNYRGFKASFHFVTDFDIKTGERDNRWNCGFLYRSQLSPNGTFTSPNYPGKYPRNTECHYLFQGLDNERVHITFPVFDVEGVDPNCQESTDSDYVELSNFNVGLPDRKMSRLCGNRPEQIRREIISDSNFFRVTFKSNNLYDAAGFQGIYQFRKIEADISHGKQTRSPTNSATSPFSRQEPYRSASLLPLSLVVLQLAAVVVSSWTATATPSGRRANDPRRTRHDIVKTRLLQQSERSI